jgi:hypothetical protein
VGPKANARRDWLGQPVKLGEKKWLLLFVGLLVALTILLFPLFVRAGFPPPSPCVTDRAFWMEHPRECALGIYDPVGLQPMIDQLYLSGARWVASLLVATASAFFGALTLTILVYKLLNRRSTCHDATNSQR